MWWILAMLAAVQEPVPTVANPDVDGDGTQRWSVLARPCADTAGSREGGDILVCGRAGDAYRLPLPGERPPPDRPLPGNPEASGRGAMAVTRAPCGTLSAGCPTGIDLFGGATFLVRMAGKLVDPDSCCDDPGEATDPLMLLGDAAAAVGIDGKEKTRGKRVPIPLD